MQPTDAKATNRPTAYVEHHNSKFCAQGDTLMLMTAMLKRPLLVVMFLIALSVSAVIAAKVFSKPADTRISR